MERHDRRVGRHPIFDILDRLHVTRAHFAREIGLRPDRFWKIAEGQRPFPKGEPRAKAAAILGIPESELFHDSLKESA